MEDFLDQSVNQGHDADTERAMSLVLNWRTFNQSLYDQYRHTSAYTNYQMLNSIIQQLRIYVSANTGPRSDFHKLQAAAIASLAISTATRIAQHNTSTENSKEYARDLLIAFSAIQKAENFSQLAFLINCEYDFCDNANEDDIKANPQILTLVAPLLPQQAAFSQDSAYYKPLRAHGINILRTHFNTTLKTLEEIAQYCSAEANDRTAQITQEITQPLIRSSNEETETIIAPPFHSSPDEIKPLDVAIRTISELLVHERPTEPLNNPNQQDLPLTSYRKNGAWELFGITWGILLLLGGAYWKNTENKNGRGTGNAIAVAGFGIASKYASQYAHKNGMPGPSHLLNAVSAIAFIAFPAVLLQESDRFKHTSVVQIYKELLGATFSALQNYKDSLLTR